MKNSFKDEDQEKVIKFLNHLAKHAQFTHTVAQSIEFFKLLTYMQQELLPKIDANVLEIKRVVEATPPPNPESDT